MASLQSAYSCTVLAIINPHHRISPFSAHARRSHRIQISCSGGGDLDRRSMLLSIGGLYGAGSLISDRKAQANPIKPAEFDKCKTAGINCCPPPSDKIIDYKLPPVNKLRIRPAAHKLSGEDAAKYAEAVRRMKELDKTDPGDPRGFTQQAMIHCAYCDGAHNQAGFPGAVEISVHFSWMFFPFHRWYLYFHERILGSLINDPSFAVPFWNWDNPDGMQLPAIFNDPKSALYDTKRNQSHLPPNIVNLTLGNGDDPKKIVANNLGSLYNEMIGGVNSAADFMGRPYREGDPVPPVTSGGTLERGSHFGVHVWFGDTREPYLENLGNFSSAARDPAFYSHHSNVDRLWVLWRQIGADYRKEITDGDYLNSSFLFYDEKKQLVRVNTADCVDHKRMGYDYEKTDTGGSGKLVKFDVYVNDEDEEPTEVNKAEYAGTYTELQHKGNHHSSSKRGEVSLKLSLKELYQNIGIDDDDDTVVVTIVPRIRGETITIGGVKIIAARLF